MVSSPSPSEMLPELSVVMPCLNEASTIGHCIRQAQDAMKKADIHGEVIVGDNGSTDGSQEIAERCGARVVKALERGYGHAVMAGVLEAKGRFVVMGDSDGTYNFGHIPRFVEKLRLGVDMVVGNRFQGGIERGAMPILHRHLGNPLLSSLGRLFFKSPCGDFHCGLRAFRKEAFLDLDIKTRGMEFASEMIVKATLKGLLISEVPTTLSRVPAGRASHLRTWRDGWRHLRFLLVYSPKWLFLYPGVLLMAFGIFTVGWLLPGARTLGNVRFDVHTLLYGSAMVLVGFQSILFAALSSVFGVSVGLLPRSSRLEGWLRWPVLETGVLVGLFLLAGGIVGSLMALASWGQQAFGPLDYEIMLRLVIPAVLALILGSQVILASFFLSLLNLKGE